MQVSLIFPLSHDTFYKIMADIKVDSVWVGHIDQAICDQSSAFFF